jgi:hypothetical protein
VTVPIVGPLGLAVNVTVSPLTHLPFASVTVAVAVELVVPPARTEAGFSDVKTIEDAVASDSVSGAAGLVLPPAVAVMFSTSLVSDDVIVDVYVPLP